ncbi:MAG: SIMPL domain-containing protein [Clostridia bacterium]|nr:SIMPL domain-containing protein [Clostridia bacterium]
MEIMVKGEAKKTYKPEEFIISLTFSHKEKTYEKCLENGAKMVDDFVEEILVKLNIDKELLKTERFYVNESTIYVPDKNKRVFDGYVYNQISKLKLDYDIKLFTKFMQEVSKLKFPPSYRAAFGLKEEDMRKNEVIAKAVEYARVKAEAISKAAGKELVDLARVDFQPFGTIFSPSSINSYDTMDFGMVHQERACKMSSAEVIEKNFNPEDIEIRESVYCLFIAK